jgi:hypothetical protein
MGAGWRLWQLSWLIAMLFWSWHFIDSQTAWVLRTCVHCVVMTDMSACNISFVDVFFSPFDGFWGDMWREYLQRLFVALHGTLGSFLCDALKEGSADVVARLHVSRA